MVDKFTGDDLLALLKTAREVALRKSEVGANDIAKELVKAIREEVSVFEAQIVQMRKLEQNGLKKSLYGLPAATPSAAETKKAEFKATCKMCKSEMSPVEYVTSRPTGACKKCSGMKKDELGFNFKPTQTPKQAQVTSVAKPTQQQVAQTNSKLISPSYQIKSELDKAAMPMSNPGSTPSVIPGQPGATPLASSEPMIDQKNAANPEKREKEKNPNPKAVLPTDKKSKKIEAEGSGGELVKQVMPSNTQKPVAIKPPAPSTTPPPTAPALKPQGVAGAKAGEAPSAPKPPAGPGSVGSTIKSDLEKAVLQDQKKLAAIASGQEAVGGGMTGSWMYQHSPGNSPAIARAQAGKVSAVKPPSMEEHAARAGSFSDFMPEGKFTQAGASVPVSGSLRAGPKPAPTVPVKSTIKPVK